MFLVNTSVMLFISFIAWVTEFYLPPPHTHTHTGQPVVNADFIVPVEIEGVIHQVYVLKRPYCDEFLHRMGEMFECILFTASLAKVCTVRVPM